MGQSLMRGGLLNAYSRGLTFGEENSSMAMNFAVLHAPPEYKDKPDMRDRWIEGVRAGKRLAK